MRADLCGPDRKFRCAALRRGRGQGRARRLLVAALHGAVALKQVIHAHRGVAEDLHLDVAGADDHLFKVALAIAKGGFGLAAAFEHLFLSLHLE